MGPTDRPCVMTTKHPSINPGSFGLMDLVSQFDTANVNGKYGATGAVYSG
jgi:hypothetical protein